jgi:hypothetical protein
MALACTYRIFLRKIGKDRLAIMVDSPHHAYDNNNNTSYDDYILRSLVSQRLLNFLLSYLLSVLTHHLQLAFEYS